MRTDYIAKLTTTLCFVAAVQRSFVATAPVDSAPKNGEHEKSPLQNFDEVKQLEDLKNSFGKTFSVLKSHSSVSTGVDGQRETHSQTSEEVSGDGKLLASLKQRVDSPQQGGGHVRTEVDIPSRGIHKVVEGPLGDGEGQQEVVENVERRAGNHENNNLEKYKSFSGVQYSPLDMAEYVFWTGDEKGVTLAIEEFLQDGLMTREEAISFLQEIKFNLDYLQSHYSQQQRFHKHEDQDQQEQPKDKPTMMQSGIGVEKSHNSMLESKLTNDIMAKKTATNIQAAPVTNQEEPAVSNSVQQTNLGISDEDYDELLERLKVADFLYTEYSLEEVIYQLAKVMFSQSLTKGSIEAQEALQKFTSFLEAEAEKGHISRSLEKKVLDVLIASLTDTLSEHPQLLNAAREGLGDPIAPSTQLLHQLVMMNPANKAQKAAEGHQSTLAKGRDHPTEDKRSKPGPAEPDTATKAT